MKPLYARRTLLGGLAAGLALPMMRPARATAFPDHTVRIVVPYAVGVGPDVVARSLAERLVRQWGQPVIVDNKPGASGIVAFGEVRQTPADGRTLFLADTATLAVNPLLHDALPYDVQRDLAPLTLLCAGATILSRDDALVSAELRVRLAGTQFQMRTRNPKRRPEWMAIHLERGPFRRFEGEWQLAPLGADACRVGFTLDYEFGPGFVSRAAAPVFDRIADSMVDAFVKRAEAMPPYPPVPVSGSASPP